MKLKTTTHEDKRRKLVEFIKDYPIRTSKVLYLKQNSLVGNHYHKLKDDIFFLVKGAGICTLDGKDINMIAGDCLLVKAGVVHSFTLLADSILIESSTTPYDKEDEYTI